MRKEFLKLMAIAVLFSAMQITVNAQELSKYDSQVAQVQQLNRLSKQVELVLPSVAEVILNSPANESKSGRLISIDNRQIQLEIAHEITSIDVENVKQIFFRGYVLLNGRKVVIRGTQNINLISLSEKLSNLKLINPIEGRAQLALTSIPDAEKFAEDGYYIVNEMSFESPEILNIKYRIQN